MPQTRLQQIVAAHRASANADTRAVDPMLEQARNAPLARTFADALRAPGMSVISEIKRRSPSAGDLNITLDPADLAMAYVDGGAACLSVLTDQSFFGGAAEDLQAARSAVSIPVLRKDFTVDVRDVIDARLMGADAVLLIVAALEDDELQMFHDVATSLGLTALVEIHDAAELERAKRIEGLRVLGVNQRNLHTFEITGEAFALRDHFPEGVVAVAESGIHSVADAQRMADVGYDAILVGTSLVTSGTPAETLRSFASVTAR